MERRATVSVIIAAHNAARFLPETLGSVAVQDWPTELIVVDDGSTDRTRELLATWPQPLIVIEQANRGLPVARNVGLGRATGRYVLFLDADDILGEGVVAGQVRALEAVGDSGVAVCRTRLFSGLDDAGQPIPLGRWRRFPRRLDIHLCHFNVAPPLAFLVRREAAMLAGGFDVDLGACEDHDFWLRLQALGQAPFPGAEATVWYRRHPGSMSSDQRRQHRHDLVLHQRVARRVLDRAPGFDDAPGSRRLACLAGMLLTAERLGLPDAAPLVPWLTPLAAGAAQLSPGDSRVYDFYLARCLLLSRSMQPAFGLADPRNAIAPELAACATRAGHAAWNGLGPSPLARLVDTLCDTLYAAEPSHQP